MYDKIHHKKKKKELASIVTIYLTILPESHHGTKMMCEIQ